MARRRRARVSIPDDPGLSHGGQEFPPAHPDDPWSESVVRSWADATCGHNAGDHDALQPDYWFRAEVSDVDFDVHFRLGRSNEGELVVTGLILGDESGTQPITTSNLHRLPIGAIYEAIGALDDVTTALAEKAHLFEGEVPKRGGQSTPREQIREAAQLYKRCLMERPNDPVKCVAEKLGVSSATASRRVSRARDLGLLSVSKEDEDRRAAILEQLRYATVNLHGVDIQAERAIGDDEEAGKIEIERRQHEAIIAKCEAQLEELERKMDLTSEPF